VSVYRVTTREQAKLETPIRNLHGFFATQVPESIEDQSVLDLLEF